MTPNPNPFATPLEAKTNVSASSPTDLYFQGSLSQAEAQQANQRLAAQRRLIRHWGIGGFIVLLTANVMGFAYHAVVYDERDMLMPVCVAAALIGVVVITLFAERQGKRQESKSYEYPFIAGRISHRGLEFIVGQFPILYQWDDFAGYQIADDVALLFIEFPSQFNYLSASLFENEVAWRQTTELIQSQLKPIKASRKKLAAMKGRMTHCVAGVHKLGEQLWNEALDEFGRALAIDPNHVQSHTGMGLAWAGLGQFDNAVSAFDKAVEYGATDSITRYARSAALLQLGRHEDALLELDSMLDEFGKSAYLLRDRGLVTLKLGRLSESLDDATAAIELDPEDAVAWNNRAATLIALGRPHEAVGDLNKSLELDPNFERPKYHLARAHEMLHKSQPYHNAHWRRNEHGNGTQQSILCSDLERGRSAIQ